MHANTIEIANEHHVPTRLGLQVASVSVLLGSSIIALIKHEPFITPTHALAYLLMFVGGILPACAGQLSLLLSRTFWRQTFVAYAISAELALGLHDLMLSARRTTRPAVHRPVHHSSSSSSSKLGRRVLWRARVCQGLSPVGAAA